MGFTHKNPPSHKQYIHHTTIEQMRNWAARSGWVPCRAVCPAKQTNRTTPKEALFISMRSMALKPFLRFRAFRRAMAIYFQNAHLNFF
jgi:hypothetical protein